MHILDHQSLCMYAFSAAYLMCMARFNGDSAEQLWASTNLLGPATRQMNLGHRQDVISSHFAYWNWMKIIEMAKHLEIDLRDAQDQYIQARNLFCSLSILYHEHVEEWRKLEAKEQKKPFEQRKVAKGEVKSLYEHRREAGKNMLICHRHLVANIQSSVPSRTAIYQSIVKKGDKVDGQNEQRSVEAAFLIEGMNIHHAQRRIVGRLTLNQTETVQDDIDARWSRLDLRLEAFRITQDVLMPAIRSEIAKQAETEIHPENERLFIPSDFDAETRNAKGLTHLASLEMSLREGELYDALEEVRQAAKNHSIARDQKITEARGQRANTRSQGQIRTIAVELQCCIDDYNGCRRALLNLGYNIPLPEMKMEHTFRKSTSAKRGLGDSRRTDGQLYTLNPLSSPGMEEHTRVEVPSSDGPVAGTQAFRTQRGRSTPTKRNSVETKKKMTAEEDGWIWRPGTVFEGRGLSEREQSTFELESDRVQWFRAKAEKQRWQEAKEKREADLRNCTRGFAAMKNAWMSVVDGPMAEEKHPTEFWSQGHSAYARRQSQMYWRLESNCRSALKHSGVPVELPPGTILSDRISVERDKEQEEEDRIIEKHLKMAMQQRQTVTQGVGIALAEQDLEDIGEESGESDGSNEDRGSTEGDVREGGESDPFNESDSEVEPNHSG
ncbi:hypothetical protein V5O48_010152 [Marasmius crinis-equi]|uniref:Uncharacterized protein n=1 Tax=Marasmius crinis-equi TaxID=585013 RepID=A0ABR3F981_9AGAR